MGHCRTPLDTRGVDEGLREEDRELVLDLNVRGQPHKAPLRHPGHQVRHPVRRPPCPAVVRGQLERPWLPSVPSEPRFAAQRDMSQALADDALNPHVVALLDEAVPEPVGTPAPGRTHRDRAKIDGRTKGRKKHHGRHADTSRTKWSVPNHHATITGSKIDLH